MRGVRLTFKVGMGVGALHTTVPTGDHAPWVHTKLADPEFGLVDVRLRTVPDGAGGVWAWHGVPPPPTHDRVAPLHGMAAEPGLALLTQPGVAWLLQAVPGGQLKPARRWMSEELWAHAPCAAAMARIAVGMGCKDMRNSVSKGRVDTAYGLQVLAEMVQVPATQATVA